MENDATATRKTVSARVIPAKKAGHDTLPDSHKHLKFDYKFQRMMRHYPQGHIPLKLSLTAGIKTYRPKLTSGNLPGKHSLEKYVPHIYNQGSIGACVAHSAAQAIRIVMGIAHSNKYFASRMLTSSGVFYPSRLYIYFNARQELGEDTNQDIGCTNYGGVMALRDYKAPDEDVWPYESDLMARRPSHKAYTDAAKHTVFEYSEVDQELHAIKDAIHSGAPVMAGIMVYPSFVRAGTDGGHGNIPLPDLSREEIIGGHSILLVGYNDEDRRFTFVNHWGSDWGRNGFGFIPYDYITDRDIACDFFAIESFQ